MAKAKITNIEMKSKKIGLIEIRLSWDNGRHHAVHIKSPHGTWEVADALERLAALVINDPIMRNEGAKQ